MTFINWGHESPEQKEIRRRLDDQALYEQAIMIKLQSQGGIGGGGKKLPKAEIVTAKHIGIWYNDITSGALKFFVANYEDLTFSEEIVLDADFTSVTEIIYDDLVDGRGWIIRTRKGSNNKFHFIDAGGNLIKTVDTGESNINERSFDGFGSALSYTNPGTGAVTLKWWGGDTIYSRTFANVDADYVYFNNFNYDNCTIDGTGDFYYYDTSLSTWRNFIFNFYTGMVTEITDLLTYKGVGYYDSGMHSLSNFLYYTFQTENTSSSTASYLIDTNTITLSTPNTSIRIGDAIYGPSIPGGGAVVINIVGATLTIDKIVTGTQTSVAVDFNGSRMELVRIIRTDGTYIDYDLLQFNVWGTDNLWLVGTDKLIIYLYSVSDSLPDTLLSITCDGNIAGYNTLSIDNAKFDSYNIFNAIKLNAFSSYAASPNGAESFGIYLYNNANTINDGKMWRYSPVMFVWTDTITGEIYTYEPTLGVVDFNITSTPPTNYYVSDEYLNVPVINSFGFGGSTMTVDVVIDLSGNVDTISINSTGLGYSVGDQVVIPGNLIGGSIPTGNITLTITELQTFGISDGGEFKTAPTVLYVNSPNGDPLTILQLNQDGTTSLLDTATDYSNASSYFANEPLGDNYVLLSHYDSSQAPTNQFWGIWDVTAGHFVDNDWIWTTTDNSWGTNYDTFWMSQNTENKIYWWNSAQGDLGNTITEIVGAGNVGNGVYLADDTDYHNYIDYHRTGTTLILDSATQGYLLSSNFTPPALVDIAGQFTNLGLNKTHFYNLRVDHGNYVVDVYDLEGSRIQTIATGLDTYDSWRVVGDRCYLTQEDGTGNYIIYAISPTSYATKTVTEDGHDWYPNDWRYWD